mgnify:CR=1 FL=1
MLHHHEEEAMYYHKEEKIVLAPPSLHPLTLAFLLLLILFLCYPFLSLLFVSRVVELIICLRVPRDEGGRGVSLT